MPYRLYSYSNFYPARSPMIRGAVIESHHYKGSEEPSPVLGVGHYGTEDSSRQREFASVNLLPDTRAAWQDASPRYIMCTEESLFNISGVNSRNIPFFGQATPEQGGISTSFCLLQLLAGFRYQGALITGDLFPNKRSILNDFAENTQPFSSLLEAGMEVCIRGRAAAAGNNFWADQYLLLLPRKLVLRVEYGGGQSFPRVVNYLCFDGEKLHLSTLEDRIQGGFPC